ncbi:MAG: GNAT family N-acetyltransferase [Clostridia bacterium]|nr:GNAT family N-acetyltransferase [Clostridia bacterium]
MELFIKNFSELSLDELWQILKVRADVFIVEQNCAYQDIDEYDKLAYHLFYTDEGEITAYLRVLPQNTFFETPSIGRVLSVRRRQGLASQLVSEGIKVAKEKLNADKITIEAQTYVKEMYEKLGFIQTSDEFLDVGIPHVKMELNL